MSLNMSEWACHFTSTANITACGSHNVPWHAYQKNTTGDKISYNILDGFYAQGDDLRPSQSAKLSACEDICSSDKACLGFTFESDVDVSTDPVVKCSWKKALHFTANVKTNCVAPGGTGKPSCAPLPGEVRVRARAERRSLLQIASCVACACALSVCSPRARTPPDPFFPPSLLTPPSLIPHGAAAAAIRESAAALEQLLQRARLAAAPGTSAECVRVLEQTALGSLDAVVNLLLLHDGRL